MLIGSSSFIDDMDDGSYIPLKSNPSSSVRDTASKWLKEIFNNRQLLEDKLLFLKHMQDLNQRILAPELSQLPSPRRSRILPNTQRFEPSLRQAAPSGDRFEPLQPLPQPAATTEEPSSLLDQFRGLRARRDMELTKMRTQLAPELPTHPAVHANFAQTQPPDNPSSLPMPRRSSEPTYEKTNTLPRRSQVQDPLLQESLSNMREVMQRAQQRSATDAKNPDNAVQNPEFNLRESLDSLNDLRQRFEKHISLVLDNIPEEESPPPSVSGVTRAQEFEHQKNPSLERRNQSRRRPSPERYRGQAPDFGHDDAVSVQSEASSLSERGKSPAMKRFLPHHSPFSDKASPSSARYPQSQQSEEMLSPPSYTDDPTPIKSKHSGRHKETRSTPPAQTSIRESLFVEESAVARAESKFSGRTLENLRRCFGAVVLKTRDPTGAVSPGSLAQQVQTSPELSGCFSQSQLSQLCRRLDRMKRQVKLMTWTDFLEEVSDLDRHLGYREQRKDEELQTRSTIGTPETPKSAFEYNPEQMHVEKKQTPSQVRKAVVQESIDLSNLNTMKLDQLLEKGFG